MRRQAALALALSAAAPACAPNPEVVLVHPGGSEAAREVIAVEFTQTITQPDNFVLRPDEFSGVAIDSARRLAYVGTRDEMLLALDASSGQVRWEVELGGAGSSTAVLAELGDGDEPARSILLVGTDNGVLYAIDPDTQATLWRYETPGRIRNAPVVAEGVVYFANSRDQIYALDMATGAWRWQYEQEFSTDFTIRGRAGLSYRALVGDEPGGESGLLYTGFDNGRVVALGAGSGEPLWIGNVAPAEGTTFIDCDSTPLVDAAAGTVFVSGQSTGVHALSLEDGSGLWTYPVVGAGTIAAAPDGLLVAASPLSGVFAVDRRGTLMWRTPVDPGALSDPVVVGDVVFFTHADVGLLAFDTGSGAMLAQLRVGSGMSSAPSYDPLRSRLYAISNRGVLVAMRVGPAIDDPQIGEPSADAP